MNWDTITLMDVEQFMGIWKGCQNLWLPKKLSSKKVNWFSVSNGKTKGLYACWVLTIKQYSPKLKNNYLGEPIIKPVIIQDYNKKMGSVDQTDNSIANYQTLKSMKWYGKLLLYLINMLVLNSYILNKKFGVNKLTHTGYRKYIAN